MASLMTEEVIFLGTGVSTGLPRLSCILQKEKAQCKVCQQAWRDPFDKNYRCNVSVLVRCRRPGTEERVTVMIDAGKTMRDAALRWFPRHGVTGIDAVLLTHGHADACGGMDDLRDFTSFVKGPRGAQDKDRKSGAAGIKSGYFGLQRELPVFLNQETFDVCRGAYPYLVPALRQDSCPRRVASLRWEVIDNNSDFEILGVKIVPLPVLHGGSYVCLGFSFDGGKFVYLSDVSEVQPPIMAQLESYSIETLILDCLDRGTSPSHFCLPDTLALVRKLRPQKTLLVGMSCELGLHDEVNEELRELLSTEGLDVQLAHDGLSIKIKP
uniref:Metallo-beta-lactamase domain-containing protein n=3 Tax=Chloropicon primus TaxID=1764295 RepID=A0A7S2WXU7_9CHLO|mmetsp:Transcript_11367/g.31650  ORF Transcript_11367/g.31650 Transcript_11367/m.31650 type:complete len:325 (+) Transcript_11367:155-1129(+)